MVARQTIKKKDYNANAMPAVFARGQLQVRLTDSACVDPCVCTRASVERACARAYTAVLHSSRASACV
eukprot:6183050-Pleurochrysis_carterae.AAC.1